MKRGLMWVALALALLAPGLTLAGFGGMGNVERDDGGVSGSAFYVVLFSGLAGAAIGVAWASIKNSNSKEKFALDGAAIIGGLVGMLAGPLLMIFA